jgi:SAM-dependent methyltransferase
MTSTPIDGVSPEDFAALARTVLASKKPFRFRARGRSMRPAIPDGSSLLIEPRPFESVRRGDVVAYVRLSRIVCHRVVFRGHDRLILRGDSSVRRDEIGEADYLGIVSHVTRPDKKEIRPGSGWRRWAGLAALIFYGALVATARRVVILPMHASLKGKGRMRSILRFFVRLGARSLRYLEVGSGRLRYRFEVLWSALLNEAEKDAQRKRLYESQKIRRSTADRENIDAGLTMLEEMIFLKHDLPKGKVLLLGCGPGREGFALARRGFDVVGIDRDEGMLELARSYRSELGFRAPGPAVSDEVGRSRIGTVEFRNAGVVDFDLGEERFELVVIFSGLMNMMVPRSARVAMLRSSRRHLTANGRVLVTYLSAYEPPGAPSPLRQKTFLEAMNPSHEHGDFCMQNEVVHIYPHSDFLRAEAAEAGLLVEAAYREQRAYDRKRRDIKGYVVLSPS